MYFLLFSKSKFDVSPVLVSKSRRGWIRADLILFPERSNHTWRCMCGNTGAGDWEPSHWTTRCSTSKCVSVCVCCEFTFASRRGFSESCHSCLLFWSVLFHPSRRPVTRGQGGVVSVCHFVFPTLPVCPCAGHRTLLLDEKRGFSFLPNSTLGWPMCSCVHRAVALPPQSAPWTLFHMPARPKPSALCFHSVSCSSEMIFIPLGILDKFSWSPLAKHILGRVSPNLTWDCRAFSQNK